MKKKSTCLEIFKSTCLTSSGNPKRGEVKGFERFGKVGSGSPPSQVMLQYESQLLLDAVQDDNQLFIFAKGIPTEQVMTKILGSYACDTSLVFVLSTTSAEEQYYLKQLQGDKIMSVTTEFNANERKELYAKGGVFFITARILVVDFLKEVVPADKITGMMIFRAHNVVDNSQEAFILRLYRSKNKTGFIKAFSQNPTSFLLGYSKLNRVMRCTFLGNVSLWPRFHAAIKETLAVDKEKASSSDVIEIQLRLSEEMREIQSNLLDLVTWSVSELKRMVPAMDDEDITVETALTKGFEKIVSVYVDPVWNTISSKSKEIMNDLKVFRLLLAHLTKSDCVTFYSILCNYTSKDSVLKSSWVLTKSCENIIAASRKRIFTSSISSQSKAKSFEFKPEVHPKWLALGEILREIAMNKNGKDEGDNCEGGDSQQNTFAARLKTLIFTEDSRTAYVIRDYLCYGSEATLAKHIKSSESIKIDLPPDLLQKLNKINQSCKEAKLLRKGSGKLEMDGSDSSDGEGDKTSVVQVTLTQIERKYIDVEFVQTPTYIRPFKNSCDNDAYGVSETLEKLKPDVIILFDPNLELVRNIEVYRARVAETLSIKVYFLSFRNSVEEQIYLTSIQREKQAFEKLIEEKKTMVIPEDREAKDELNQDLWRDPRKANETVSTSALSKRNMEAVQNVQHIILVDMREFRSELPSLIHKRGIDLEPLTLDVGDYILTPDICVERKSISDLIGSLNSGRLYKQAEAMTRHYKRPIVLIEHEQQAQSVKAGIRYRNELQQIMPKLQLLTMNFPKLKLVWSPGAHYTSELFHELKRGKPQPNPDEALSILKEASGLSMSKYNPIQHSFLSKMPGIDSRNVYMLLNRCNSLVDLAKMSVEELAEIMENVQTAKALYAGLHSRISWEGPSSESSSGSSGKAVSRSGTSCSSKISSSRVGFKNRARRTKK